MPIPMTEIGYLCKFKFSFTRRLSLNNAENATFYNYFCETFNPENCQCLATSNVDHLADMLLLYGYYF